MKNECSIVQDILPLYVEEMVSDDTVSFVREHLKDCPRCRAELEKLQKPVEVQLKPDINAAPLKRLKKALLMKKLQTILCTVAILLALMLAVISLLTAPEYFEYTPDLVTVTETGVGEVTISFNSKVTNYKLQHIEDPDECNTVYQLEAWTSPWDRMFKKNGAWAVTVSPENDKPLLIYFTQIADGSSVNLYGEAASDNSGWVALPGLTLGYWLLGNIMLFIIVAVIWFCVRKKERIRRRAEYLMLIPVAYGLGHLCVLGFRTVSYSEWRDFQLILAIGILLYCAMLLALNIFYAGRKRSNAYRKELR
ncbi:zf-HC2 domain-containing protein [Dysosmobacter sp.]|jgi:hypothetical protein|uniref:zf-HC2 domain-containing protein n=1 Tax=Dysosmobacter sp. TaxID=2591382 RepID=UPI002F926158